MTRRVRCSAGAASFSPFEFLFTPEGVVELLSVAPLLARVKFFARAWGPDLRLALVWIPDIARNFSHESSRNSCSVHSTCVISTPALRAQMSLTIAGGTSIMFAVTAERPATDWSMASLPAVAFDRSENILATFVASSRSPRTMMCEVDEFAEMAADPKGAAAATTFEAADEAEEEGTATWLCGEAADMLASEFTRGQLGVRIPFEVP